MERKHEEFNSIIDILNFLYDFQKFYKKNYLPVISKF